MDRHIGTAITDTVTANPGMAASSGPFRFRSGVRTGAYPSEDAQLETMSTFGTDEHLQPVPSNTKRVPVYENAFCFQWTGELFPLARSGSRSG